MQSGVAVVRPVGATAVDQMGAVTGAWTQKSALQTERRGPVQGEFW